jgi:hypothetical protein
MKLKIITYCLLLVAILGSCKKEDLSNGLNSGKTTSAGIPLLSKVLLDNQAINEYVYNDSNFISQEKSKFDLIMNNYNSNGQLTSSDFYGNDNVLSSDPQVYQAAISSTVWVTTESGVNAGSMAYTYNDKGQLTKTIFTRPQSTSTEYSDFTYDANNKISRQTMSWDNTATGYIDYTYDTKGNLIKEVLYNLTLTGAAQLITSTQYDFDSKNNPYKAASKLMLPGINTNLNNIIKTTYTIHLTTDQGSDNVQVTETAYTYNASGYPITKNSNIAFVY